MKNNNCFYCFNHTEGKPAENTGWHHPCKFGLQNEGLQNIKECPQYFPNDGFQIGGYYTHIHFEFDSGDKDGCMEMVIHSDGKFPRENEDEQIRFHICDFRQLESFVKKWGEYLREKGVVSED